MMQSQIDFALATPEILLLVFGLAILLIDAVSNHPERKPTFLLTMLALGVLTVVSALQWSNGVTGSTFNGLYVTDELSHLLKIASYIAVAVTLVYGRLYAQVRDMMRGGELYVLTLFALLGQMVMISSGNLISIYLGLELMSLALYALIALRRDNVTATEAAMKYFVLGALASGFLLYGMSMVYGATGHLDLAEVAKVIAAGKGSGDQANVGNSYYNLGVATMAVAVEAARLGMEGGQPLTGETLKAGFEKISGFDAEGLMPAVTYTAEDHQGGGAGRVSEWDGEKWVPVSEWHAAYPELIRQVIEESAAKYKEGN